MLEIFGHRRVCSLDGADPVSRRGTDSTEGITGDAPFMDVGSETARCKEGTPTNCSRARIAHAESRRATSAMGQYKLDGRLTSGRNPRCW